MFDVSLLPDINKFKHTNALVLNHDKIIKKYIHGDSRLLSGFQWSINRNPYNNLESPCTFTHEELRWFTWYRDRL